MKELKTNVFKNNIELVGFVNINNIARENILIITEGEGYYTLFYY